MSAIKTVGVLGTGVIGASWTTLFLSRGLRVIVSDPAPGAKQHLDDFIRKEWPLMQRIGLAEGADPTKYQFVDNLAEHLDRVDFIQENGPEKKDFKTALFAELDAKAGSSTVLASSSSGIPSSEFIRDCKTPSRILIGHPFNPPHLMPLVEVVSHPGTDPKVVQKALEFYKFLGKSPIHIKKEAPGFVANRLQAVLNTEAMSLVNRGVVSAKDVDLAVTTSLGIRWAGTGPIMSNLLGGGGNRDGFMKIQKSIGRAAQAWLKDMDEHRFEPTDENLKRVDDSLQEWLDEGVDLEKVGHVRDEVVLNVIDTKKKLNVE